MCSVYCETMAPISGSEKRAFEKLSRRCLTLDEKIKILDENKMTEEFNIGKTKAANIIATEACLRAEYENFEGKGYQHVKRKNHQKDQPINTILYSWYKKCEASRIYVTGLVLKE